MYKKLSKKAENYFLSQKDYHFEITCELAQIPAPSWKEEKRAEWVKNFFDKLGATGSYIDSRLNCVLPINCEGCNEITVFMAHTDVVFPDTEPLPLSIDGNMARCPGITDDTANLTGLLMVAKYIIENNLQPKKGILIVANTGEEGLGNLKGTKQIFKDYDGRIKNLISFDGGFGTVCNGAVGSHRYSVKVKTEGGHSYGNFGNRNAIAILADMIETLYTMKVPPMGRTTYNVGTITGGTSVNSIAQSAEILYEYRSDSPESLKIMEKFFNSVIDAYRAMGIEVDVNVMGKRPCTGDVDKKALEEFSSHIKEICESVMDMPYNFHAGSTDANIPLSMGVPGLTLGIADGKGAHTREEFLYIDSLPKGLKLAGTIIGEYFEEF